MTDAGRRRVALGVAYDGTGFHGFARQPGQRTVAGTLLDALGRLTGEDHELVCAGRTDAGVHALAQVVHVDLPAGLLAGRYGPAPTAGPSASPAGEAPSDAGAPHQSLPKLASALDRQVRPEARVWRAVLAPDGFDARHSATARRYRYDLDLALRPDPTLRGRAWRIEQPVDLARLRLATDPLLGEHDFAAFCRRPPDRPDGPLTREVLAAHWSSHPDGLLRFEIEARSFCHQMVRSLVAALVAAGTGRLRPSDVVALLHRARRDGLPAPAPPGGLTLVAVRYPPELGGDWC